MGNGDDAEAVGPEPLLDLAAQVLAPLLEVGEGDGDGADGRRRRRLVLHGDGAAPDQAGRSWSRSGGWRSPSGSRPHDTARRLHLIYYLHPRAGAGRCLREWRLVGGAGARPRWSLVGHEAPPAHAGLHPLQAHRQLRPPLQVRDHQQGG